MGDVRLDKAQYSEHALEMCQDLRSLVKNTAAAKARRANATVEDEGSNAREEASVQGEREDEDVEDRDEDQEDGMELDGR